MKSFHFKDNILIIMIMDKSKLEKIFHYNIQSYYIRIGRLAIVYGKPSHSLDTIGYRMGY